jgi:hypothetical protein
VELSPPVALTLQVGPVGTATYPNGLFTVGFSDPLAAVTPPDGKATSHNTFVTVHGSSTPVAGTSECFDDSNQSVDCSTGPVSIVQIVPDDPLDPGAEFDAFLNQTGAAPATLSGRAVPPATAGPVGLAESPPVDLTLAGPGGATQTAPDGPFVVQFSDTITAVNPDNVVITTQGTTTPLAGTQTCRDASDSAVPCDTGAVATMDFAPDDTLPGGSTYTATIDPPGAAPALLDAGGEFDGFGVPAAT